MDINREAGTWRLLKTLGSGGFGQVTLWCDMSTGQKIVEKRSVGKKEQQLEKKKMEKNEQEMEAKVRKVIAEEQEVGEEKQITLKILKQLLKTIKSLLKGPLKDPTVKAKLTERWCNEVEIMKKLNHANIVATLEVPSELSSIGPVLAMEYCSKGDLRQVLNKPENCCGLQESEILDILRDISNGLAYLHSCKIIHRDIKPDNIVLQNKGSDIAYKLIDLGYAKSLDESSLSKSFVGTVQYIAPELFMGKAYTSSVDYWSFGLMAHEIITGYRPFLPGCGPSEWMKQIQNKARNVISVVENSRGEIIFNSKISENNHSSSCFLKDMEKWLQLALDWDGQTRGRDLENNRLVIFENLTEIICKKIIKVFSLPTYETLSFEVNGETDISDLRLWLKESTSLEKDSQLLLLPNGKCVSMTGNLFKSLENEKLDRSGPSLFLYNSGRIEIKPVAFKTPKFVDEIRQVPKNLTYKQLKRCCADSIYFLQSQANRYRNVLQGIRVKINNIKQKTLAIESLYEDLLDELNRIENYNFFMSYSHKIDLENYIYYRKAGKLKSSSFVRKWIKNAIDVNTKISELKNSFNKTKQKQLMVLAKQRCRTLDDHSNSDVSQRTPLDSLVERGEKLWENLQTSKAEQDVAIFIIDMFDLVDKTVDEAKKFINSEMLKTLFVKSWEADENLARFVSHLTSVYKSANMLKCVIENTQAERQKEVWSLIDAKSCKDGSCEKPKTEENVDSPAVKAYEAATLGNSEMGQPGDFSLREYKNSISGSDLFLSPDSFVALPLQNMNEGWRVIEDNNHLRYRIQEFQQSCSQMVEEMASLNWDFVSDS